MENNQNSCETTFNFGCKRVYHVKSNDADNNLFTRDSEGNLVANNTSQVLHGDFKEYDRDGNLRVHTVYVDGKLHGPETAWWENGTMRWKTTNVDGLREGSFDSWWDTGAKHTQTTYVRGNISGTYRCWNKQGELVLDAFY